MKINLTLHKVIQLKFIEVNIFGKSGFISTLVCLFFYVSSFSQPLATPPTSAHVCMATGINVTPSGIASLIPVGNPDNNWKVSTSASGPSSLALVATIPNNPCCNWSPNITTPPGIYPGYSQWITMPGLNCGSSTSYSCAAQAGLTDLYFERTFWLPSSLYASNWMIYSSGYLVDVTINTNPPVYQNLQNYGANPPCNATTAAVVVRVCSGFQQGFNTVRIHIKTPQGIPANCKHAGIRIDGGGGTYPTISGPAQVCLNSSYIYSVTSNTATLNYAWTFPPGWAPGAGTPSFQITKQTSALAASGVITLNISNASGCLSAAQYSVSVSPPLTLTANNTVVCKGDPITLTAGGGNMGTYQFGGIPPTPNVWVSNGTNQMTFTASISQQYNVKAVTPYNCTYTKSIIVNIIQGPTASLFANPNPVCAGKQVTLTASTSGTVFPAGPWIWNPTLTSGGNTQVVIPATSPSTYCAKVKGLNGCYGSACAQVNIAPTPTITAVASPSQICPFSAATLNATGAVSYTWASPTNTNIGNSSTINVFPSATTIYTVRGASANGCISSATVQLQVLTTPSVVINPAIICPGVPNVVTASGAQTYTWYQTPPNQGLVLLGTGQSFTLNPTVTTTYMVVGSTAPGCTAGYTFSIQGGITNSLAVSNQTLCTSSFSCATMTVSSTYTSPTTYVWTQVGNPTPIATGSNVQICPPTNSVTMYNVSATSQAGCSTNSNVSITTVSNCCTQPTASLSVLGSSIGGAYPPGSYLLDQNTTLSLTTNFVDAEVWITPGKQITVPPGTVLDLDKVHLFACSNTMWKGIVVQDGGRIKTSNVRKYSCLIEDAEVAIDLDQISTVVPGRPAIDISEVIFNKNYIAIKISNSTPTLNFLGLGINGCVFCSRTLTFTSFPQTVLSWPLDNMLPGGLRAANLPTTGLAPPYTFPGFIQTNVKQPYTNQPGHIGIQIKTIGDQGGCLPQSGVEWGFTYPGYITNNFNLFDGLGTGIEITDASMLTRNNVFQNMQNYYNTPSNSMYGGDGIKHTITTFMLSELSLAANYNANDGNYFYDCINGVNAKNVYKFTSLYSTFRSTHLSSTPFAITPLQGEGGIVYESNRFSFNVYGNEFNNIKYGIKFSTPNGINGYNHPNCAGLALGVFANMFNVTNSYFGAEVLSTTPYSGPLNNTEYMYKGIEISTPNIFNWQSGGFNNRITSNKFDRVYNGITIDGFADETLAVGGNTLLIEDDNISQTNPTVTLQFGQGIGMTNNMGNLTVEQNTLQAMGSIFPTNSVSLVFAETNYGIGSPKIFCNNVSNSNYGFHFSWDNKGTIWENNRMCNNWAGLALTNSAVIGPQGNSTYGQDNYWDSWAPCQFWSLSQAMNQTYVENSDASLSPLFYFNAPPPNVYAPQFNASNAMFVQPYTNGNSLFPANALNPANVDCYLQNSYSAPPAWRQTANVTAIANQVPVPLQGVQVFPIPANSEINIVNPFDELLFFDIFDNSGRVFEERKVCVSGNNVFDIKNLPNGFYVLKFSGQGQTKNIKLVITH